MDVKVWFNHIRPISKIYKTNENRVTLNQYIMERCKKFKFPLNDIMLYNPAINIKKKFWVVCIFVC